MYNEKLVEYLKANPERKVVYMDGKGGWLLHQRLAFPNEVTREEILENDKAPKAKTETKIEKESNSKTPSKK